MITQEEFAEEMQTVCNLYLGDEETAHQMADELLLDLLDDLGYGAGVAIYRENQENWWYA